MSLYLAVLTVSASTIVLNWTIELDLIFKGQMTKLPHQITIPLGDITTGAAYSATIVGGNGYCVGRERVTVCTLTLRALLTRVRVVND